jgi:hypothetical protein
MLPRVAYAGKEAQKSREDKILMEGVWRETEGGW